MSNRLNIIIGVFILIIIILGAYVLFESEESNIEEKEYNEKVIELANKPLEYIKDINESDVDGELCHLELDIREENKMFQSGNHFLTKDQSVKLYSHPIRNSSVISGATLANGGVIIEGPKDDEGIRWWKAYFPPINGQEALNGWIIEDDMVYVEKTANGLIKFKLGDYIRVTKKDNLKYYPDGSIKMVLSEGQIGRIISPSIEILQSQNKGDMTPITIITSPIHYSGTIFWFVEVYPLNGSNKSIYGWVDESHIGKIKDVNITIVNITNKYGNHTYKKQNPLNETDYTLYTYNITQLTGIYGLISSLKNTTIGLNETSDVRHKKEVIKNDVVRIAIKLNDRNQMSYHDLNQEQMKCMRTCGKENENINKTVQDCCEGHHMKELGNITICSINNV
jgi:hypothetical protein